MDVTKLLASVPVVKTSTGATESQRSSNPSSNATETRSVTDAVDISSAAISGETISAEQAESLAQNVGSFFAENDEAIGADANRLAQL